MKNPIKKSTLNELADLLCKEINSRKSGDCFKTIHLVFPNLKIQQWFKAYWLNTQGDAVLLNVSFETLDSILPLITDNKFKLISSNNLRQIIINVLSNKLVAIDPKYEKYYENSAVKLYDFADSLTKLYLDYYKDNFEDIDGWGESNNFEYALYVKIVETAKNANLGTLEKPVAIAKPIYDFIYFFGFGKFEKVYRELLDNINDDNIKEFSLNEEANACPDYEIHTAPSMLREVEWIHSKICDLLKDKNNRAIDFLVMSPNLSEYVNTIERVFKQDDENQKPREFPNIPYVINYHEKKDTDVVSALKILFKIFKTGYYTRLDFNELINNSAIKRVRNIKEDEIDNWMTSIVKLKIYRQHNGVDDWDYLKKRLLLSKVSSINFQKDNLVSLNDGDYLPYSNIGFDDESILKIVSIINDLDSFCNYLKTNASFNDFVDGLIVELDKWFKVDEIKDKVFREYRKVIMSLDNLKKHIANNSNIDVDTLFYILFNDGAISSTQLGKSFLDGITFVDYDVNSVVSAKYIFLLGASSSNTPKKIIKSELDFRNTNKKSDDELTFNLLKQNVISSEQSMLFISYINTDLKTEEEYFLSPIIFEFNKKIGQKYKIDKDDETPGRIDIEAIPLDEVRPYSELYTRREYKNREYFDSLLGSSANKNTNKAQRVDYGVATHKLREALTVSEIKDFLTEPLSYKTNQLFGNNSDIQKEINKFYEPFGLDNLDKTSLEEKIIVAILKDPNAFDPDALFDELVTEHLLPTVSSEYEKYSYVKLLSSCQDACEKMLNILGGGALKVLEPKHITLEDNNHDTWRLISSKSYGLYENGKNRTYFDFRAMEKSQKIEKFLPLYVISLMDIAVQPDISDGDEQYHVYLVKNEIKGTPADGFGTRSYAFIDNITPQKARETLNNIHSLINKFSDNRAIPLAAAPEKIDSLFALRTVLRGNQDTKDVAAWAHFDYKRMIVDEELGFNDDDLKNDTMTFIEALNEQIENIKYLRLKKKEDDK